MKSLLSAIVLLAVVAAGAAGASAQGRSVGQVIDDATITTEIKAKLTADALSNLTKIGVNTRNGVVTLTGEVDSLDRRVRAVQIASSIKGVRTVVDNIQVTSAPMSPGAPSTTSVPDQPNVDVTGVVSQVDPSTGTIILQDGRVLRMTSDTLVWQPSTLQSLRPGTPVIVRDAAPIGVQPAAGAPWRMGTVHAVDRANSRLVLTDGTVVRLAPTVNVHRGPERLGFDQIVPGSEIVIRPVGPSPTGSAEGSAFPGKPAVIDAAEINVVWMPAGASR
jgi:hyperosmotically inducible periplasmic protein